MRHVTTRATTALAAILIATQAAAVASKSITLQLRLPKKPPEPRPVMAGPLTKGPLSLTVVDAPGAENDLIVGVAQDQGADVYQWRASQPVAPAVSGFVAQILTGWAIPLA